MALNIKPFFPFDHPLPIEGPSKVTLGSFPNFSDNNKRKNQNPQETINYLPYFECIFIATRKEKKRNQKNYSDKQKLLLKKLQII